MERDAKPADIHWLALAGNLLDLAADSFANQVCNEWEFPPQWSDDLREAAVLEYHQWNGDPQEAEGTDLADFCAMSLAAAKLKSLARNPPFCATPRDHAEKLKGTGEMRTPTGLMAIPAPGGGTQTVSEDSQAAVAWVRAETQALSGPERDNRAVIENYLATIPPSKEINTDPEDEQNDVLREVLEDILRATASPEYILSGAGSLTLNLDDEQVEALVKKWASEKGAAVQPIGDRAVRDLCLEVLEAAGVDDLGGCPLCQG